MNLTAINTAIEELAAILPEKIRELQKAEAAYQLRFWDLMLKSGMGNQEKREAEANLVCQEEGLLEPLQNLKGEVRALYHQKDCYLAMAANLRTLSNKPEPLEAGRI